MKVVLDTNVLASGTLNAQTPPGQLLDAWRERAFDLIISQYILDELAETLQDPYFQARTTAGQRAAFLHLLRDEAILTAIEVDVAGAATHPEDDSILATAVSAQADYLITGDRPLINKLSGSFRGVQLLTPRAFLDMLHAAER